MSWIRHDLTNRQEYIAQLVSSVRLALLPQDYLVQRVEEESLVKSNTQCKDFLIEAMKYHLLKPEQKLLFKTPRAKPRTPVGLPKVGAGALLLCVSYVHLGCLVVPYVSCILYFRESSIYVHGNQIVHR